MGVFDKASLALVPDGIKDGKLYSIKPTDGSGDFTFTRGSNLAATRVDENGLIEKGRENFVGYSNDFSTGKTSFGVTVSSGEAGYDGTNNAWKLIKSTSSGDYLRWLESGSLGTAVFTYSIYVKAGSLSYFVLWTTGGNQAYFELTGNGSVTYTQGSALLDSKIESVGNGWYRCSLTAYFNNTEVRLYPTTDGTPGVAGGTSGDFVYIQNFQAEYGLVATEYIDKVDYVTGGLAGVLEDLPRIDYTGGTPSLLMEPSRTNLIEYSEYLQNALTSGQVDITFTPNYGTSPEGVKNSTRIQFADESAYAYRAFTITTDTIASMYVKGTSGETFRFGLADNAGTGGLLHTFSGEWERISNTRNTNGQLVISSYGGTALDFEAYGLQLEEGSYPTSYIPTYGAIATRGGDLINSSVGNAQVGNNLSEGTWFIDFIKTGQDGNNQALYLAPLNSNSQQIRFHFDQNQNARFRDGRNGYVTIGGSVTNTTSRTRVLVKVDLSAGIAKVFANGAQVGSDYTLGAVPFEFSRILGEGKNFKLFSTVFFPEALSDAECITLTT